MRFQVTLVLLLGGIAFAIGKGTGVAPSELLPCLIPLVVLVLVVVAVANRGNTSAVNRMVLGIRLLNRGRYSEALAHFDAERNAAPNDPVVLFDCGITRLQLWQLDRAHGLLEDAWRLRKLSGNQQVLNALVPEHLALVSALRNDGAKAKEWLALVPAPDADPARNALVNGVLAAHGNDWARARQLLGPFEVKQLGGVFGGLVRAVDALCIERLTGEVRHLDRVALYGETGPEELRKVWPEFVEFVDRSPAW